MEHATIGAIAGNGVNRETLTKADKSARDLFAHWCREAGLVLGVDQIGNMFCTRAGADASLDAIAIGSHLDTQPTGGRFDGILGVLAGLEICRALDDAGIVTRRPITLVNWTNEEGSRFTPSMLGSGAYAGRFTPDFAFDREDKDGVTVRQALAQIGYAGSEAIAERKFHAHLELHIEQGPVLEAAGCDIGVVTGSQAMSWNEIVIHGRPAHAGTTPMYARLDPFDAALRLLSAMFAAGHERKDARVTVGGIQTRPHSHSTIPKTVTFFLDLRHPDQAELDRLIGLFEEQASLLTGAGFTVVRDEFGASGAQAFDERLVDAVRRAAGASGYTWQNIVSGAGHDAIYVNAVCPSAMIFVPCKNGISHNPAESITSEQATAGTQVLLDAVLELSA